MTFDDFKEDYSKLVGHYVLWENGRTFDSRRRRAIRKIEKATKTGFRISGEPDTLFDFGGRAKGLSDKTNWSVYSVCTPLTDDEARDMAAEWKQGKEKKVLREKVTSSLDGLSLEQLQKILAIINKEEGAYFKLWDTVEKSYLAEAFTSVEAAEKWREEFLAEGNYPDRPVTVLSIHKFVGGQFQEEML